MHLKSALLTSFLAASIGAPASADDAKPAALPQFSEAEMHTMFEQNAEPVQLAALSQQEMRETEGAWWVMPVVSGGLGTFGYVYNNPNWNYAGAATAFASGAFGGAMGGYLGMGAGAAGSAYATHVTGW